MTLLQNILAEFLAQSWPELVAVVSAIAYLVFAIRQQIVCWLFAAISSSVFVWVFFAAKLPMESALNGFYVLMAAYGFWQWNSRGPAATNRPVVMWPLRTHAVAILLICLLSAASGFVLATRTAAAFPYMDSLTTWFAIWATFLMAQKVFENWWYWLLIDLASVFIYLARDLQLTAALFLIYIVMIPFGMLAWSRSMNREVPL